jgi:hypothetical protein
MNGPVFLAGIAGSGKTLLRLALTSHPRLAISRRTYMWTRFYNRYGDLGRPENLERCLAAMLARKPILALHPDPSRIRREFAQGEPTYARLFALFHQHYAEGLGRPRWGDQLGFVERYADDIFRAYPGAQMIHMVRDPRDRYGAAIARGRRRVGAVGAATARWLQSAELAVANARRYPGRYKVVRSEDLAARFEETVRDICRFLNEDYVPEMLTLEGALRFGGEGEEELSGESLAQAAIGTLGETASSRLSRREVAFIEAQAKSDMAILGYNVEPTPLSLLDRLLFYAVDWPVNRAGMVAWRVLSARQQA